MTYQEDRTTPPSNEQDNPAPQSPAAPQSQGCIGANPKDRAKGEDETSRELAREFRWVEWAQVIINGALAVIGIMALCIYHGQLTTMQGQLTEMHGSGTQTDQLIALYRQQLAELQKQVGDTHELTVQAKNQADSTKAIANSSLAQAKIGRDALYAQQRPWVGLDFSNGGLNISGMNIDDKMQAGINYAASMKNFGSYPAENAVTFAQLVLLPLVPGGKGFVDIQVEQAKACQMNIGEGTGETIFPNTSEPARGFWPSQWKIPQEPEGTQFQVFVVGCVIYSDQFGARYKTGFSYWLLNPKLPPPHIVHFEPKPTNGGFVDGVWVLRNEETYKMPDYVKPLFSPQKH
jgi:hypothetical protein